MLAKPVDLFCRPAEWIPQLMNLQAETVSLPATEENLTKARIVASLGVRVTLDLSLGTIDWEALRELLVYAVYGRCSHAIIEPFETMIEQPPPQQEALNERFINRDSCINCPGWRACYGEWKEQCTSQCRDFFTEIIDARLYRQKQPGGAVCRP